MIGARNLGNYGFQENFTMTSFNWFSYLFFTWARIDDMFMFNIIEKKMIIYGSLHFFCENMANITRDEFSAYALIKFKHFCDLIEHFKACLNLIIA